MVVVVAAAVMEAWVVVVAWVVRTAVVAWVVVLVVEVGAVADLLNSSERSTKDRRAARQFITPKRSETL
jgi:hypothetical protein